MEDHIQRRLPSSKLLCGLCGMWSPCMYGFFDNKSHFQRFRRDADDSLALNDRLKEKLEGQMEEHMNKISNMTCVLRELNVIDSRNNIDIAAMKADAQNKYKVG